MRNMPSRRFWVWIVLLLTDMIIIVLSPLLAILARFDGVLMAPYGHMVLGSLPFILVARLGSFWMFRLYHRVWKYASIPELMAIFGAGIVSSGAIFLYMSLVEPAFPRSVSVLSALFTIGLLAFSRFGLRVISHLMNLQTSKATTRAIIIGAGDAGAIVTREIINRYRASKVIVGFIDDDHNKWGQQVMGLPVFGGRGVLERVVRQQEVTELIIAIPSASGAQLRQLVGECKKTGCSCQMIPGLYQLVDGKVSLSDLRRVDIEDLLRREPVQLDMRGIGKFLHGKRVLVTGAGGSIGAELCRQIACFGPERLLCLGRGENSIFDITNELKAKYPDLPYAGIIANVQDEARLRVIFERWRPQVVFHAAAHKHVPLMEAQPIEAVHNNIFGTRTVAEMADRFGAEAFVQISTDKAVNPTSVMGASKRVAELIIQNLAATSRTRFSAVRFGNVLGSRGSVVPTFRRQIAAGGPVTITHPDMRRYFMTIPEAVQLVLQTAVMAQGGEVFVLDMGEPVKILDLARDLIELSGLTPYEDIPIEFTGLRPGEKLFEELLTAEEGTCMTCHEKIYTARITQKISGAEFTGTLGMLEEAESEAAILRCLKKLVPTYTLPHTGEERKTVVTQPDQLSQQTA